MRSEVIDRPDERGGADLGVAVAALVLEPQLLRACLLVLVLVRGQLGVGRFRRGRRLLGRTAILVAAANCRLCVLACPTDAITMIDR